MQHDSRECIVSQGSNYLCAKRTAAQKGETGIWGPEVHESTGSHLPASTETGAIAADRDRHHHDTSVYEAQGGSNWLSAERTAEQRGEKEIWGPPVHESGVLGGTEVSALHTHGASLCMCEVKSLDSEPRKAIPIAMSTPIDQHIPFAACQGRHLPGSVR